jgi:hypothetical protein
MLINALVFYFKSRSRSKFKFQLESKEFKFLRGWNNGKKLFSIPLCPWAEILAEAQPAGAAAQPAHQTCPTSQMHIRLLALITRQFYAPTYRVNV